MKFFVFSFLFIALHGIAQSVSYNDVGVIVNLNSSASIQIGAYFKNARNIPEQNMIYVNVPNTEVINDNEFVQLRTQIENYLISQNLINSLNYLVTTKGIPLKRNGDCLPAQNLIDCGSVDQELSLILGPHSSGIGAQYGYNNPYFQQNTHFSRSQFGIYLVSRLDGYSVEDVTSLIDRSGPLTSVNQLIATSVIDLFEGIDSSYFVDQVLAPSELELDNLNWNTITDYDLGTPSTVQNVLAYIGSGHGPTDSVLLNYGWLPGSFSSINTCSAAQTFNLASNTTDKFLIANLIKDGCTAAYGHVNCITFAQLFETDIMLNRYLDPVMGYNLAESYMMAERFLSNQSVLVGDPKASIIIDNTARINTNFTNLSELTLYPNPNSGIFQFKGLASINGDLRIQVVNTFGIVVLEKPISDVNEKFIIETPGMYLVHILSGDQLVQTFKMSKI